MGGCCSALADVNTQEWARWADHPVRKEYDVIMDLGEGAFSLVVLCKHKTIPDKLMALKVVYLQSPAMLEEPEHREIMLREAVFLRRLYHRNIVQCEDVVNNGKQMVIVMEFLRGGQLFDSLENLAGEHYTEQAAAGLFAQMAAAIQHMHSFAVMHRDVKGENFIFLRNPAKTLPGQTPTVKLIDLGMSAEYDPKAVIKGALGSPGFVAPEIVNNRTHTPAMDIFSLGVVLFVMLVGRKPYSLQQCETLAYAELPLEEAPGLQDPRWKQLSENAKDLLLCMLKYDPKARLTAKQVMHHPWVATRAGSDVKPLSANVAKGAATTAAARRFRSLVHGIASEHSLRPLPRGHPARDRDEDGEGTRHSYSARLAKQQSVARSTRGYRGDPHERSMSRSDRESFARDSDAYTATHDRGGWLDSGRDMSKHIRMHKDRSMHGGASSQATSTSQDASVSRHGRTYYSIHGGRLRFEDPDEAAPQGTAHSQADKQADGLALDDTLRGGNMRQSLSLTDLQRASNSLQKWKRWGLGAHQMLSRHSPPGSQGSSMHDPSPRTEPEVTGTPAVPSSLSPPPPSIAESPTPVARDSSVDLRRQENSMDLRRRESSMDRRQRVNIIKPL